MNAPDADAQQPQHLRRRRRPSSRTIEGFTVQGPLANALGPTTSLRAARALARLGLVKLTVQQRQQDTREDTAP
jgi:hypothetical protein